MALLFYGAMAGAAGLLGKPLGDGSLLYTEGMPEGIHPLRDLGSGLAAALLLVAVSRGLTLRTRAGDALARRLAEVLGPLSAAEVAILALASGIGEELFFRGALQPWLGLVATSLLFGVAHLVPTRPLALWSVFACAAGLLFGALFELTGNLVAPVVAHVAVNALNLRWLVRRYAPVPTPGPHSRN
jgi:membrane protease YdiL (CAAX protease family)